MFPYSFNNEYPILDEISLNINENAISQFDGEIVTESAVVLNKIDISQLGIEDLMLGNGNSANDYYAVSQQTGKIYYVAV